MKEIIELEELKALMKQPSSIERGKKIAQLSNWLELNNDDAWHFGLGKSLKSKKK